MKKTHVQITIILVAGYLLVTLLDSRQWNIMVYSLLLIIIIDSTVQDVLNVIKTTKGIYTDGEVVDMQHEDRAKEDNEEILVDFISPVDNQKYQIKSSTRFLDKQVARSAANPAGHKFQYQ